MTQDDENVWRRTGPAAMPRSVRRLSDKILIAFDHACATNDIEVAEELLRVLEMVFARRTVIPDRRRQQNRDHLVAAYEQVWRLRHPDQADELEGAADS